jgi:hypothetical protein
MKPLSGNATANLLTRHARAAGANSLHLFKDALWLIHQNRSTAAKPHSGFLLEEEAGTKILRTRIVSNAGEARLQAEDERVFPPDGEGAPGVVDCDRSYSEIRDFSAP